MDGKPAHWIQGFARAGYAAKGVLYLTISALAASAALGFGGRVDGDSHDALRKLFSVPFGRVFVAVIAVGLAGYATWRCIEGVVDPNHKGRDAKGIAIRASYIFRGLFHLVL